MHQGLKQNNQLNHEQKYTKIHHNVDLDDFKITDTET